MQFRHLLVTTFTLGVALSASAQSLKPGLWEISHKTQFGAGAMSDKMAAMKDQMASLPPDQRKMMEDMMAKQGVSMGAAGGVTVKTCITKSSRKGSTELYIVAKNFTGNMQE